MYALFFSCYKKGKFPICSIGPSWPFTIGLMVFALMCLGFLICMLTLLDENQATFWWITVASITINLLLLFGGILGDPGVHQSTYLHYTKIWYNSGKNIFAEDSDGDEEAGRPSKRKEKEKRL